ncbi:WRKY domain [Sesbania bispinosa]|nr:WRKY domain [Sesbania bispinosa]
MFLAYYTSPLEGSPKFLLFPTLLQRDGGSKKVEEDLRTPYSADTRDLQVQRILSSYEKALQILRWNESTSKLQTMSPATTLLPESPMSTNGSPLREEVDGAVQDYQEVKQDSKKRKIMPKWMDQVRVSFESGLEGPHEDGYNWRKYGQKDILGAKYPR